MATLSGLAHTPLARLLEGVDVDVFRQRPRILKLRDLHREMSSTLKDLRAQGEYRVLTNRGAPAFLLIPIDPHAWTSLLVAATESDVVNEDDVEDPHSYLSEPTAAPQG